MSFSEIDLFGNPRGIGCSIEHYPIWRLDPSTQVEVYKRFRSPAEAKQLFLSLLDKVSSKRLDGYDDSTGFLKVEAIQKWSESGFPGSWDEWWEQFYTGLWRKTSMFQETLEQRFSA